LKLKGKEKMKRFILPLVIALSAIIGVTAFAYAATGNMGSSSLASNTSTTQASTTQPKIKGSHAKCLPKQASSNAQSATGKPKGCHSKLQVKLRKFGRMVARRSVQDQFIVKGKNNTWVTINVDRGTIGAITSSSITVDIPDGNTVTAPINTATRFVGIKKANIAVNDRVVVIEKNNVAVLIGTAKPKATSNASNTTTAAA
jgi:molybdopterin-binding protein